MFAEELLHQKLDSASHSCMLVYRNRDFYSVDAVLSRGDRYSKMRVGVARIFESPARDHRLWSGGDRIMILNVECNTWLYCSDRSCVFVWLSEASVTLSPVAFFFPT